MCQDEVVENVTFYWLNMHQIDTAGTITMRATGYEDGWHWTGAREFTSDHEDYEFWGWLISQEKRWAETKFISSDDIPSLKAEYEADETDDNGI